MNSSTQVLVIGGGPAGSTAATLLAREGFDVTLVERDVFPRYHIGESLLPSCLEILELTGALEKIEAYGFLTTDSAEPVKTYHRKAMPVILTAEADCDLWLSGAPWEEVKQLQRPLPEGAQAPQKRTANADGPGSES